MVARSISKYQQITINKNKKYKEDTMRRSDREIKDFDEIIEVINKCDVCRLAINDGDYPYIVPMNFGLNIEDGKVVLYFHCASEGKKLELLRKNNKVAFEMDCGHEFILND